VARMIKVYNVNKRKAPRVVTLQEAQRIIEDIYCAGPGQLVVDGKVGRIIRKIGPDVEEVIIIPGPIAGG